MSSGEILEILAFCIHAREKSWNIGSGAIRNRVAAKEAFPSIIARAFPSS
jgi:hypothetical protein